MSLFSLPTLLSMAPNGDKQALISSRVVVLPAEPVTATTGQLADNHDVLALSAYSKASDAVADAEDAAYSHAATPLGERHAGDEVALVRAEMALMRTELEHRLEAMAERAQNSLRKLREQEAAAEERIRQLEARVQGRIENEVTEHVRYVRDAIGSNITDAVSSRLHQVSSSVEAGANGHPARAAQLGGGWKLPFACLLTALAGTGFVGKQKYCEFKKSHLL